MVPPSGESPLMSLAIENLAVPLADFSLEIHAELPHRTTVVFGASGSGKTTLLESIAGWRQPARGRICLGDTVLHDSTRGLSLPIRRRHIGYVPQDLALFPHLTVRHNLQFGARGRPTHAHRLQPLLELLELGHLLDRRLASLSGGERQRVALGRALLTEPRLLLLDEPLANLDLPLKRRILHDLARIRELFDVPLVYVTHDRFEALSLADQMLVLVRGQIAQTGTPTAVFNHPATLDVAGLLTVETVLPGNIIHSAGELATVRVGATTVQAVHSGFPPDRSEVYVCIRAEHVVLLKGATAPTSARNHLPAVVKSLDANGPLVRVELDCGFTLTALLTQQACQELSLHPQDPVTALVKAPHVHLILRDSPERAATGRGDSPGRD